MGESTYLLGHDAGNLWIAVSQRIDCYSGCEVEVFPVLDVPEIYSFAFDEHWGGADVGFDHVRGVFVDKSCG